MSIEAILKKLVREIKKTTNNSRNITWTRFNLKFFRYCEKNIHARNLHCTFLFTIKVSRVIFFRRRLGPPDRKMIPSLRILGSSRLSSRPTTDCPWVSENDNVYHVFPPKWRWFTCTHYLVLKKSRSSSRPRWPRLRIETSQYYWLLFCRFWFYWLNSYVTSCNFSLCRSRSI